MTIFFSLAQQEQIRQQALLQKQREEALKQAQILAEQQEQIKKQALIQGNISFFNSTYHQLDCLLNFFKTMMKL
jgi:predicted RNA binding protein with dsRBD fold (UPF0201 family)